MTAKIVDEYEVLFREFLLDSGWRNSRVRAAKVAEEFNWWLGKKGRSDIERIDGRMAARILKRWGTQADSRPFASTFWYVSEKSVCPKCGGYRTKDMRGIEATCTLCGEKESLVEPFQQDTETSHKLPHDDETASLEDFL